MRCYPLAMKRNSLRHTGQARKIVSDNDFDNFEKKSHGLFPWLFS